MSTETQQATAPAASTKPVAEGAPMPEVVDAVAAEVTVGEDGVAAVEAVVAALSVTTQSDLHRACAEGRLEDVRALLARGLQSLETLDMATGMTPIVLAIQNGHTDVVRELLAAGAIVPPPGITGDPVMLSILYPQPMYGVPPPFAQMGPPQFYPPHGFYPPAAAPMRSPNGAAPNSATTPSSANLPPADVAKTIPCRNFPNCKYGASCMFFHPRPQPGFFPSPGYGYEGFVPYPGAVPYFPGQEFGSAAPTPVEPTTAAEGVEGIPAAVANGEPVSATSPTTPHDSIPASAQQPGVHVPSPVAPAFIPGGVPFMGSPTAGFPMGPLSPTLSPHPDPAFFGSSPQYQPFVANGFHGRRQSFGQFPAGGAAPNSKPYHGKKPSFSGGPKPWGPGGRPGNNSHLGAWKDGNPPPCAFFREGKCRNGEFCKFPHIDADGNDVRHPDVVRGIIPPAPTRPRVMRMMGNGHYDPRHQFAQGKQGTATQTVAEAAEGHETAADEGAEAAALPATESDKEAATPATPATTAPASATLPPKPATPSVPPSRSASHPGGSRVNGGNSRAHSPNGAVRRGPRYANGHANGSRSSSANPDKKLPPQRIPRADEFPALGLSVPNTPTIERREPSWGSKTAAQVLSEPAPSKPVSAAPSPKDSPKAASPKLEAKADEVTMDSDSEQDTVIVSVSTTPNPEIAKAKLASAASFASVAGTLSAEASPVALKA